MCDKITVALSEATVHNVCMDIIPNYCYGHIFFLGNIALSELLVWSHRC